RRSLRLDLPDRACTVDSTLSTVTPNVQGFIGKIDQVQCQSSDETERSPVLGGQGQVGDGCDVRDSSHGTGCGCVEVVTRELVSARDDCISEEAADGAADKVPHDERACGCSAHLVAVGWRQATSCVLVGPG